MNGPQKLASVCFLITHHVSSCLVNLSNVADTVRIVDLMSLKKKKENRYHSFISEIFTNMVILLAISKSYVLHEVDHSNSNRHISCLLVSRPFLLPESRITTQQRALSHVLASTSCGCISRLHLSLLHLLRVLQHLWPP